ncbi:MAG: carbohydrate kinase, partial [Nitrospirae bacterium]
MEKRPVIFGEVLFDVFPDGTSVLGGAPFNVAWHLEGFGFHPLFISRVGRDREGEKVVSAMEAWHMDTSGLQFDPKHPTGIVKVSIKDGHPEFSILPERAYDYIEPKNALKVIDLIHPSIVYYG